MSYPIHPDDVEAPRFGGWADDFNTYAEACAYYGCDTPDQIEAENRYYAAESHIEAQDEMEARGGPAFGHYRSAPVFVADKYGFCDGDEIPF